MTDNVTRPARLGKPFFVLLGVALVLRVAFVFLTRDDFQLVADLADYHRLATSVADYHRLATSVAEGDGFGETVLAAGGGPTAFRAPLFPALLGVLYAIIGPSVTGARLVLGVGGVLTVALIGILANRLFGRRIALIATAVAAVYPPLMLAHGTLITEAIFLPLELGSLVCAVRFLDAERTRAARPWLWLVGAGVLAGLATLSRQAGLALVAGVVLFVLFRRGDADVRRRLMTAIVTGIAAVAVIAPWTARNIAVMDYPFIVSADDGFVFAGVFNDEARNDERGRRGIWRPPTAVREHAPLFEDRDLNETELARELRSRGLDYAFEHPSYAVYVMAKSAAAMFELLGPDVSRETARFHGYPARVADVAMAGWFVVASLALVGAFTRAVRRAPPALWITPLLFTGITIIVLGTTRYRAPLEPFFVMLAALGIDAIARRVARTQEPAP